MLQAVHGLSAVLSGRRQLPAASTLGDRGRALLSSVQAAYLWFPGVLQQAVRTADSQAEDSLGYWHPLLWLVRGMCLAQVQGCGACRLPRSVCKHAA